MFFEPVLHFLTGYLYPAFLVLFFFGLAIFIHELGHFLVAKRRRMKVERFSIGMGPKMYGWKKDGIEYRVSWIPAGGYVMLPQMMPAEALEGKSEASAEVIPPAPPLSKILVSLAGPAMNFVLAFVFACLVWMVGLSQPVNPSIVGWIEPGSAEDQMGIRPGDRIVQINGQPVRTWEQVLLAVVVNLEPKVKVVIEHEGKPHEYLLETKVNEQMGVKTLNLYPEGRPYARAVLSDTPAEKAGLKPGDKFVSVEGVPTTRSQELIELIGKRADQPTELKVMRDGQMVTLTVIPKVFANEKNARIGVALGDDLDYEVVHPGPTPTEQFSEDLGMMGKVAYALFHHKETGVGPSSLSGPVGIAGGLWHEIVHGGWRRGLRFTVMVSINLAIINLLPLPVLDGGHILFALIEAIRRKPLNDKLVQNLTMTFVVLLISFILYVTFFDVQRLTGGRFRLGKKPPAQETTPTPKP